MAHFLKFLHVFATSTKMDFIGHLQGMHDVRKNIFPHLFECKKELGIPYGEHYRQTINVLLKTLKLNV